MNGPFRSPPDDLCDDLRPHILSFVEDFPPCENGEIAKVEVRFLIKDGVLLDFDINMEAVNVERL